MTARRSGSGMGAYAKAVRRRVQFATVFLRHLSLHRPDPPRSSSDRTPPGATTKHEATPLMIQLR